jgi:hypothetical protein
MKRLLFLLSFLVFFVSNTLSQCTTNAWGQYGNISATCGSGVFGAWSSITGAYSREYSIVNVVSGNTYEFQTYRTSNNTSRFATITTTANAPLVWGVTSNVTSVFWTANFTGQVRFWTHLNSTCGANTDNSTRRVRCNSPISPCAGTLVTLNMNDSWGDGWNGGQLTINGNLGNTYGPYTLSNGFSGTSTICLIDDCYSINVTGGLYPGEISWSITNGATPLANGGAPVTLNDVFSVGSATCAPPAPGPCINTISKMTLVIQPTGFFLDEVGYTLFNSSNAVIQSGNNFPNNVTAYVNLEGQPQPYTLSLETQGTFNDNTINYSVFCGNDLIASGSLGGGQIVNLTNLQCNFNMPIQSNPSILSACPTYGSFTDEYTEWTNGVAGTDYVVTSSVSSDWITITSINPNGTVVAFGSSPLIWTAPTNGTYFIHVSTNGFCGQDANCRDITVERISVLPVTLISFITECDNEIPVLRWATASEQNSDYFQIERSQDGFVWVEVSKIQAMGNSNTIKNYQFYDMAAGYFKGYYRLKQVDFDGEFEYFNTIYSNCVPFEYFEVEVYPNPVEDVLIIKVINTSSNEVRLNLRDVAGRLIFSSHSMLENKTGLIFLDTPHLHTGQYLLEISSGSDILTKRVIKK